jgi:hypothetical protein
MTSTSDHDSVLLCLKTLTALTGRESPHQLLMFKWLRLAKGLKCMMIWLLRLLQFCSPCMRLRTIFSNSPRLLSLSKFLCARSGSLRELNSATSECLNAKSLGGWCLHLAVLRKMGTSTVSAPNVGSWSSVTMPPTYENIKKEKRARKGLWVPELSMCLLLVHLFCNPLLISLSFHLFHVHSGILFLFQW